MTTMDDPTRPMAAAWPELPSITADEVFAAVRFSAVSGLPLPSKMIPVAVGDTIRQMSPDEWRRYKRRCDDERELDAVLGVHAVSLTPRFG